MPMSHAKKAKALLAGKGADNRSARGGPLEIDSHINGMVRRSLRLAGPEELWVPPPGIWQLILVCAARRRW